MRGSLLDVSERVADAGTPPASASRAANARPADLDLTVFGAELWRFRYQIIASTIVAALVTFGVSLSRTPVYEGVATLLITQTGRAAQPLESPVRMEPFRVLIENRSVASTVIRDFNLVDTPRFRFLSSARPMSPSAFLSDVLRVEQLRDANVLRVFVRLTDGDLAARVANRLGEEAIALNRKVNQDQVVLVRDYIKTQLDEAERRLNESKDALLKFKESAQIDALRRDAESVLAERGKLLGILVESAAEKARLESAETALQDRSRFVTTRRSIDREPALMEAARDAQGSAPTGPLGLSLDEQSLDAVFETLELQAAKSRGEIAALENRRREIAGSRQLDAASLPLLTRLYEREAQLARLELDFRLQEGTYSDLATRYEQARVDVQIRSSEIQIVDPAQPPDSRLLPTVTVDTLLAGGLALLASVLLVTAVTYLRQPRT